MAITLSLVSILEGREMTYSLVTSIKKHLLDSDHDKHDLLLSIVPYFLASKPQKQLLIHPNFGSKLVLVNTPQTTMM